MRKNQWPEVATLVAGGCLTLSPWVLGYGDEWTNMFYSTLAAGLALALLSLAGLLGPILGTKERAELPIAKVVIGLWAVASPWVLAFATQRDITISTVALGAVAAAVSLWQLVDRYQHTHHLFE